tara:strand:+ start:65 stop:862 length:798 start_codon:yes stop_codon:yes gene_type:complete
MKFFACIIGISIVLMASTAARLFEDKYGRIMDAQLVSHPGFNADNIKIDKGGKKIEVKVNVFSIKDQEFIRNWMKNTPPTLDYAFRIDVVKKKQSEIKGQRNYYSGNKTEVYVYSVTVTNLTRQPVGDLRIDYRTVSQGQSKDVQFQQGSESVKGPMRYNDTITFITMPLTLQSVKSYGYRYKESLLGVILRIHGPGDKLVEEWHSPGIKMDKITWDSIDQPVAPVPRGFTEETEERDLDALKKLLESGDNPFRTKKPDVVKSGK